MSFLRSKRAVVVALILLLALFLIRPGANRLRTRIVTSISMALGRPVDVAAVKLRLLPQPGFDLQNFVVHEDPAFGAEPLLRSSDVTASLRIASLLRGRIEIARLSLTEPSLNLVRNSAGHWNLENLIERAAKVPVAPTSKAKTEKRPGFPYIEADRGRINFKFGPEKKPYALTDADFALWQDSENAWGMRLKAQPVRTDFNLSDTGTLSVDGSWQRAALLSDTPLQFTVQWSRGQLGQLTKLAYGRDKGWRGGLTVSTTLSGTPANLAIVAAASLQDFRRYDIFGSGNLRLAGQCSGRYSSQNHVLSEVACTAPVSDGSVTLAGSISGPFSSRDYNLVLTAHDLPVQSLVAFLRHAKQGMADDLIAAGRLNGNLKLERSINARSGDLVWEGRGEASGVELGSKLNKTELLLGDVPLMVSAGAHPKPATARLTAETRLEIGPFNLALGRVAPATVQAWVSRSGYDLSIQGDAQLQHLLQVTRTVGIPTQQPNADGQANVDLQIAGSWSGFAAPRAVGKAQLHSIHATLRGLNAPLEIASANLILTPEQISVQKLTASIADTSWRGSLTFPRQCVVPESCPIRFDLRADEISTDQLNQVINPYVRKQPWYHFLTSPPAGIPYLLTINAVGKLSANRVIVRKLVGSRVSAKVELDKGKLRVSDLRADVLGGKHDGEWEADFTAKPPQYRGKGEFENVALDQLSESMNDAWITGSAMATYHVKMSGLDGAELFASASSRWKVEARDGRLGHVALTDGGGPLPIHRLSLQLAMHDGKFEIEDGKLDSASNIYRISGTASMSRVLNIKLLLEGAQGFNITGTLTEPHVSPILPSETQAALKP